MNEEQTLRFKLISTLLNNDVPASEVIEQANPISKWILDSHDPLSPSCSDEKE